MLETIHWADTHSMPRPKIAQHMYNALVRQLDVEWFRFAAKYRLHTTVYNPLAGGLLTDARLLEALGDGAGRRLAEPAKGSRFDGNKLYQRRYWSAPMVHAANAYRLLAEELGMTLTDLAYAFACNRQGVDSVILGPGSVAHLDAGYRRVQAAARSTHAGESGDEADRRAAPDPRGDRRDVCSVGAGRASASSASSTASTSTPPPRTRAR